MFRDRTLNKNAMQQWFHIYMKKKKAFGSDFRVSTASYITHFKWRRSPQICSTHANIFFWIISFSSWGTHKNREAKQKKVQHLRFGWTNCAWMIQRCQRSFAYILRRRLLVEASSCALGQWTKLLATSHQCKWTELKKRIRWKSQMSVGSVTKRGNVRMRSKMDLSQSIVFGWTLSA